MDCTSLSMQLYLRFITFIWIVSFKSCTYFKCNRIRNNFYMEFCTGNEISFAIIDMYLQWTFIQALKCARPPKNTSGKCMKSILECIHLDYFCFLRYRNEIPLFINNVWNVIGWWMFTVNSTHVGWWGCSVFARSKRCLNKIYDWIISTYLAWAKIKINLRSFILGKRMYVLSSLLKNFTSRCLSYQK
jgi:hypothetical protein